MRYDKPMIIKSEDEWRIRKEWTTIDGDLRVEYLCEKYGDCLVQVADCDKREFSDMKRHQMTLSEYLNRYIKPLIRAPSTITTTDTTTTTTTTDTIMYLKDWHFCRQTGDYSIYEIPEPFQDDWLDEWSKESGRDDFRFIYLGMENSWTPLHADVFRSFSWSTNIIGRKEWILYPPEQSHLLISKYDGISTVFDVKSDLVDDLQFPLFHLADPLQIIQEAGETIFIPSNWFHQVHNHGVLTLSVNHNFINAWNVEKVAEYFMECLGQVRKSLADLLEPPISMGISEWEQECQKLQKDHFGMSIEELVDFLVFIRERRSLKSGRSHDDFALMKITDAFHVLSLDSYLETKLK